ncbi:MAG: hydroxymethylglutaryl-CoA reductase, degradative [Anaerolineales bacterium]|nr:hydroxymethylglutaryl-CoA reductase, degradative [Anaerolineales bacterium]
MPSRGSSRIPGFYNHTRTERLRLIADAFELEEADLLALEGRGGLNPDQAEHMIENVVGMYALPLGIATNFVVNKREVLIPMVVEEPSIIAGASYMARFARLGGGFTAQADPSEMIGQIQILDLEDPGQARKCILAKKTAYLADLNKLDRTLVNLGGGARDLEIRILEHTPVGTMLIVHLIYDTRDAMGANAINTAVEFLAPRIESDCGGRVHLRILSNLSDRRLAHAQVCIPAPSLAFDSFSGDVVRDGIIEAWAFAEADPYRAATHNKGIMNGIDAVVLATGNDWRAVEAGAHAYAARSGRYTSLSHWKSDADGNLRGELTLPLALGVIGGATRVHPAARASLALMGVSTSQELAQIAASVGLAQNLAALRALATEGIQRGHMTLHARQIAIAAGAAGDEISKVAGQIVSENNINLEYAQKVLGTLRTQQEGTHD